MASILTTQEVQQRLVAYYEDAAGCGNGNGEPPEEVLAQYDRHGGLSVRTIQRMCKDGRLQAERIGRDYLVSQDSLEAFLARLGAEREEAYV